MDFDLSEDQQALAEAAGALLDAESDIPAVRRAGEKPDRIDRGLWSQMAEQGWPAVEIPDPVGLGMGFVEVAVLSEELGKHLSPVPFAGNVLTLGALAEAANASQDQATKETLGNLVEKLGAGEAIGAVAWSRRPGQVTASQTGSGPTGTGLTGTGLTGTGWTLTGRPDPVIFGPVADVVLVTAAADGEDGLFAVVDLPESSRRPEPAMDLTRSLSWLELDSTPALRIGDAEACALLADRAAVATSAEMLGSALRVLDMTVEYAKDRVQFGRPIGSFQAVKHRCADMLVDIEGMRSAVYYAAWCLAAKDQGARIAASVAKIWCSEAASRVMGSALQVHGGIGFTWEHDLHLFVKRSQLDQVSFGDATWHRDRLARLLRPLAEAGLPVM